MAPQLRFVNLQRPNRRRCIVSHGGGLSYGLVRWCLAVPLNQIEATASKCAKETLRHPALPHVTCAGQHQTRVFHLVVSSHESMNRNAIGFTQVKATLRGAGVSLPDRCQKNTSRTTRNPGIAARSIASHRWCYLDPGSRAIESETLTGDVVVKRKTLVFCSVIAAMSPAVWADSLFDGTWRPEYPQKASPGQKHDITELKNGVYECRSCTPPYTIQADGMDYPVKNNPDYDARNVKIVDAQTITKSVKKGGSVVFESKVTAAADGTSLTELQTI